MILCCEMIVIKFTIILYALISFSNKIKKIQNLLETKDLSIFDELDSLKCLCE